MYVDEVSLAYLLEEGKMLIEHKGKQLSSYFITTAEIRIQLKKWTNRVIHTQFKVGRTYVFTTLPGA